MAQAVALTAAEAAVRMLTVHVLAALELEAQSEYFGPVALGLSHQLERVMNDETIHTN